MSNIQFAPAPPSKALKTSGTSLPCPVCGSGNNSVIDSRPKGIGIRRRRSCQDCDARFSTFETVGATTDTVASVVATARDTVDLLRQRLSELEASLCVIEGRGMPAYVNRGRRSA